MVGKDSVTLSDEKDNLLDDVSVDTPELDNLESKLSESGFLGVRTIKNSYLTLENLVKQIDSNPIVSPPDEGNPELIGDYQTFLRGLDKSGFFPILYNVVQERGSGGVILLDKKDQPIERKYLTIALSQTIPRANGMGERIMRDAGHTNIIFQDHIIPYVTGRLEARAKKLESFAKIQQDLSEIDKRINEKHKLEEIQKVLQLDGTEFILLPDNAYNRLVNLTANLEDRRKYLKGINDNTSARELFYAIMGKAREEGASDVHLEPLNSERARIRYRVDGLLREGTHRIPDKSHKSLVSFIKAKTNKMLIEETRRPQDGAVIFGRTPIDEGGLENVTKKNAVQIQTTQEERELELKRDKNFEGYSLRISTMPVEFGEKMAIRIQKPHRGYNLKDFGYPESVYFQIKKQMHAPDGIMLVTGPTSSGKSTSLYAILSELNTPEVNIVTIEDPVEINQEGMNQSKVINKIDWTFATALRTYLRQDPDIMFIGEIRDLETAQVAMEASKTGHRVFSTLHTNDSILSLLRLQDLGVNNADLEACLRTSIAQRLVRVLCPSCKQGYDATSDLNDLFGEDLFHTPIKTYIDYNSSEKGREKQNSCVHCNGYGFKGRTVISEIWVPGREEKRMIHDGNNSYHQYLEVAHKHGMRPLASAGLDLFLNGKTTIPELVGWIDRQDFIDKAKIIVPAVRDYLSIVK